MFAAAAAQWAWSAAPMCDPSYLQFTLSSAMSGADCRCRHSVMLPQKHLETLLAARGPQTGANRRWTTSSCRETQTTRPSGWFARSAYFTAERLTASSASHRRSIDAGCKAGKEEGRASERCGQMATCRKKQFCQKPIDRRTHMRAKQVV